MDNLDELIATLSTNVLLGRADESTLNQALILAELRDKSQGFGEESFGEGPYGQ